MASDLPEPRPEGLALAAEFRPVVHGLTVYAPKALGGRTMPRAISDLATALYGPTARVGHTADRKPPAGYQVVCYVTASSKGPALPVLLPIVRREWGAERGVTMQLRVSEAERDAWDAAAAAAGVSRSEWLRAAAERALRGA